MHEVDSTTRTPSFWRRMSALWIDFALLLGAYMILGFISENIFSKDAYPRATSMAIYVDLDFRVYWFFVRWILILTAVYLLISYLIFGRTLGQIISRIRLFHRSGSALSKTNIFLRTAIVLIILALIMIPGPVVAILYFIAGERMLNGALSMALLLGVVFFIFYRSFTQYSQGKSRSLKDRLSGTIMLRTDKPSS